MKIDGKIEHIYRDFISVAYDSKTSVGVLTIEVLKNEATKNWKEGDLVTVEIKVVG